MPRYIVKLNDGKADYFMEWSTVVDAPVTYGMPIAEFEKHYRMQYGEEGMRDLTARIGRALQKGTSSMMHDSVIDLLRVNRAGRKETCLSPKQILDTYCVNKRGDNEMPIGHRHSDDGPCKWDDE